MILEMLPYKNIDLKTKKILEQLTVSSRALAELKGYANTIPNMHILINAVTINEAKDSSAIENIVTTHDDIHTHGKSEKILLSHQKDDGYGNGRTLYYRSYGKSHDGCQEGIIKRKKK